MGAYDRTAASPREKFDELGQKFFSFDLGDSDRTGHKIEEVTDPVHLDPKCNCLVG